MNDLYKRYDQNGLKSYNEASVDDRLSALKNWCNYEFSSVVCRCDTITELEELYKFINCGIGVEFLEDVYDLINEDKIDGDTETEDMCKMFNEAIGRDIISLS
jgi:hypothetical protein